MNEEQELKGLGGWLILVGFGVVMSPFRLVFGNGAIFYSIFTDGTYTFLTTPGTEAYNRLWRPLITFEAICNVLIILTSIYLIYLFFSKHHLFPKVYIAFTIAILIVVPLDAWLGSLVITDEPMFDPETMKEFGRAIISALIWCPYMLLSKRVKTTFTEHRPSEQAVKG